MKENKETKYITIGTPIISKDIFRNILRPLNNYGFKPTGGLWASKYNLPYARICPWYDYLLDASGIVQKLSEYKDLTKAAIFTLKENANILVINKTAQILELAEKYPSYHHLLNNNFEISEKTTLFDFEDISKIYDGIYINYENIYYENKSTVFDTWSVDTLLLFNLNCIKEYQSVKINVDFNSPYPLPYIDINSDISTPRLIADRSQAYYNIYNYVKEVFKESLKNTFIQNSSNYNDYFELIITTANKVMQIVLQSKEKEIKLIQESLEYNNLKTTKNIIIRNIVLNYLTEYLSQEKEKIKTLPKSLIKERKMYEI